jgi:hypothetical protein
MESGNIEQFIELTELEGIVKKIEDLEDAEMAAAATTEFIVE